MACCLNSHWERMKIKRRFGFGLFVFPWPSSWIAWFFLISWPLRLRTLVLLEPCYSRTSLVAQMVKNLPTVQETRVRSLGGEDPLEKGMGTHSSILAWRIPWTEEPGRLQSMGSPRVRHPWSNLAYTSAHIMKANSPREKSLISVGGRVFLPLQPLKTRGE